MKICEKIFVCLIAGILAVTLSASARGFISLPFTPSVPRIVTVYDVAVEGTIVPAELLRAIARRESGEKDFEVGDNGLSIGRFQLYEVYHAERAAAWGEYDPRNPVQAGRVAALFLQDCIIAYSGDIVRGICAYRQGVKGVEEDGPTVWYYDQVMERMKI
jgi:hypothetical protein